MPFQVHLEMPDGKVWVSKPFERLYEAASYATRKAKEERPFLIALREVEEDGTGPDALRPDAHG